MQAPEPSRLLELPQEVLWHVWKYLERDERGPGRWIKGRYDPITLNAYSITERNTRDMVALRSCSREARIITATFITGLDINIFCHYVDLGIDDHVRPGLLRLGRFPSNATLMKLRLYVRQLGQRFSTDDLIYQLPSRFFTQAAHMLGALQTLELDTTGVGGRDQ